MSQCVSSIIIVQPTPVSVVQVGVPGPSGPTGAPGSASIPILLTETVSGDLAVTSAGTVCDFNDPFSLVGIALQGGNAGTTIQAQFAGLITNTGWNWTPDETVFLGAAGSLTQTPPTTGYLVAVGYASSPTSMIIRLDAPISI